MSTQARLDDKYTLLNGTVFMTGVQALVRLPIDQARSDRLAELGTATLVTGYQGSPLAGFDMELLRHRALLAEHGIEHRPALNEELAATAVLGSQLAHTLPQARVTGVVGLWYGKSPGLDRAMDAIRHANLIGVGSRGGALAAVGDDALSKSSTLPSSSEAAFFDLLVPFVAPADPQEVLDLGRHAMAMSRACGLWAGMKIATNVADGSSTVVLDPGRIRPVLPEMELDGRPFAHRPTANLVAPVTLELERTLHDVRLDAARRYGAENGLNRIDFAGPDDRIGIIAPGKTYLDLRQALRRLGLDDDALGRLPIRLLKVGMPFPLDEATIRRFARGLDEVVVIEEKRAFLELFAQQALYAVSARPRIVGKRDEHGAKLVPSDRELDADGIAGVLGPRLARWYEPVEQRQRVLPVLAVRGSSGAATAAPPAPGSALGVAPATMPMRTPWFCSGCPHSTSTQVPENTLVGGGIGCHGMVLLMPPERVGNVVGLTQMGGEGAQWIGMAPFTDQEHFVQNVGDGTFFHSGSLGVRAAVAAGVNVTFKILRNSAVAMTGGQHAVGSKGLADLTRLLASEGVVRTIVTTDDTGRERARDLAPNATLWSRDRVLEAQRELAATPGVTALIHDQECAAELRRKRKRGTSPDPGLRVVINERACEGCGDCGATSNCLSVQPAETEFGRKTRIHQNSCNVDLSCLKGDCPSFITVVPGRMGSAAERPAVDPLGADALPDPAGTSNSTCTVRIVGVGGTGVITVAQILGTAALLDGLAVRGLDQTGLAQKGGPVVSDVRLFSVPTDEGNKAAAGDCDLYLGCDLLVAADARYLAAASPDRTRAVVSLAQVPTGAMVIDTARAFPAPGDIRARIDGSTRADENAYLDPQAIATALFGSERGANVVLLGVAWQLAALPVSAAALERAIELNGASIEENIQAFRRGRQWVADPPALAAAIAGASVAAAPAAGAPSQREQRVVASCGAEPGSELERLVAVRVPDLAAYHDIRYAERYAAFVARTRAIEASRVGSTALTEAVARQLHRLMAFKDEYEVARLHLDPETRTRIEAEFGPGARVSWHLHPPLLRALGLDHKLRVGSWFAGVYRVLRAMRRLRFTPLDPFGRAHVRRLERELIGEYRGQIENLLDTLTPEAHATAVELADLPEMIRGYEGIKLESVARYRARRLELETGTR